LRLRLRAIFESDLLVLDDLFLSRTIPDAAGALLQTLIHQRYKLHRSVLVTSNRVVQDWGAYSRPYHPQTNGKDERQGRTVSPYAEG
jgi:DNA replication protein DnaC